MGGEAGDHIHAVMSPLTRISDSFIKMGSDESHFAVSVSRK